MLTKDEQVAALRLMTLERFAQSAGFACYAMIESTKHTRANHTYNVIATLKRFIDWAEANELSIEDVAMEVADLYATLPGAKSDA